MKNKTYGVNDIASQIWVEMNEKSCYDTVPIIQSFVLENQINIMLFVYMAQQLSQNRVLKNI